MRNVCIIGGGVIGLCTAWYALRDGHRVTLIERGPRGGDRCSLGNSGLIVPSHLEPLASPGVTAMALSSLFDPLSPLRLHPRLDPDYLSWCWCFWRSATHEHVERSAPALLDLTFLSKRCYLELAQAWENRFGLHERGCLMLCRTQSRLDSEAQGAEFARRLGVPAEVLDARATADMEPRVRMSIVGSVYYPFDAHLTPQLFVHELENALAEEDVDLRWSTEARGWRHSNGHVEALITDGGEVKADEFVLACGSWSARTARGLGLKLPLQAGKGYNVTMPNPRVRLGMSAILTEARVGVTPMGEALRFAGTLELAGLDTSIDPRRVQAITDAVPAYFPDFSPADFANLTPWSGLRPCTPDGLPYIGRPRRYDNLVIATGHAMMGLSLGPATGTVVSDLIARRTPSAPLERFDPDRFS